MNKEWSELNKIMQTQIRKKDTYEEGIATLFELRNRLMETLSSFYDELNREEFNAIPFINADGYHSKTIAYSIWHIFRIEDIVAHTLISEDEQIFFAGNYQERINPPIITTGNELVKQQIADFSKQLNLKELYSYIFEVKESTEKIIKGLSYVDLKKKVSEERKEYLKSLHVVSNDENAIWLIDYWCNKDLRGLIQMPFSRHWIMHVEAGLRIKNKVHL
ncbi:MAG: phage head-tail adapter protein [Lachnospiraceae bacterium]|nr:phage head-tail adapter protein [Lachnospiraceae bacterium]